MSFRRERYVPKGGPDGGDGGDGGDVVIIAENGVNSLVSISSKKQWRAEKGTPGKGAKKHGRRGQDQTLRVPPGTIVIDEKNNLVIKDLVNEGDSVIAARGGKGGKGNTRFKSSTNQAPRTATPGGDGEQRRLVLELKVIADVGLIGKPNAGKSTLLSRLTSAKPEIADYPFTTKFPNLGQVVADWNTSFVIADIPGLIEGASEGIGLGHDFLKHIERSGILVHLVEPAPMDGTDPIENYHSIRNELVQFNEALRDRPEIVVVTKAELPDAAEVQQQLQQKFGSDTESQDYKKVLLISAVTGSGLPELLREITRVLEAHRTCNQS